MYAYKYLRHPGLGDHFSGVCVFLFVTFHSTDEFSVIAIGEFLIIAIGGEANKSFTAEKG